MPEKTQSAESKPFIASIVMNRFVNDARVLKASSAAVDHGFDCTVFALGEKDLPNYEVVNGAEVYRYYTPLERLVPTKTFRTLFRFLYCYFRIFLKLTFGRTPKYVHANDLTALPAGVLIKFFLRCRLIYDSHELWCDASRNDRWPNWLVDFAIWSETKMADYSDELITVSPGILEILKDNFKTERGRVLLNVPAHWRGSKTTKLRDHFGLSKEHTIVLYQGVFDEHRGIQYVFPAFKLLPKDYVFVILGGDWNWAWAKSLAEEHGVSDRVFFHPTVPYTELLSYTTSADMGIYPTISSSLSYRFSLPNKFFEYIQARLPVVVSDLPDVCRFLDKYQIGVSFRERDSRDIANKIQSLKKKIEESPERLSENLQIAAHDLSWDHQKKELIEIYKS